MQKRCWYRRWINRIVRCILSHGYCNSSWIKRARITALHVLQLFLEVLGLNARFVVREYQYLNLVATKFKLPNAKRGCRREYKVVVVVMSTLWFQTIRPINRAAVSLPLVWLCQMDQVAAIIISRKAKNDTNYHELSCLYHPAKGWVGSHIKVEALRTGIFYTEHPLSSHFSTGASERAN